MKVVAASIVLNESQYIGANLRQHYDFVDRWIIVEGADRRYPSDRVTADGLSTDDTAKVVAAFDDPLRKIRFVQHGWAADKSELRNRYADLIDEDCVVIVFDADEFLSHEHLAWLIRQCETLPRPGTVRIPHVHYWKSAKQVIVGGYYDVPHDRAYRWKAGCRYGGNHNHPEFPDGSLLRDSCCVKFERQFGCGRQDGKWVYIQTEPHWQHFGFCKGAEHVADKNAYYVNRGEAVTRPETTRDRAAWFGELPEECRVYDWVGELPEVFRG